MRSIFADRHRPDCWYRDVCALDHCSQSCKRYNEMKFLMDSSGIPPVQQTPVKLIPSCAHDRQKFERLQQIKDSIVEYIANGNNLYITSNNVGNGKSSWALKLLLKYFDKIWAGNGRRVRGMFIHVPTFLSQLKNFDHPLSEEYKYNILNADVIIWDDIASTALSQWDYAQLLIYIDNRVFNKKSNFYTSNIADHDKLEAMLGARLTSRIYSNSEVIEFIGKDWRGADK